MTKFLEELPYLCALLNANFAEVAIKVIRYAQVRIKFAFSEIKFGLEESEVFLVELPP